MGLAMRLLLVLTLCPTLAAAQNDLAKVDIQAGFCMGALGQEQVTTGDIEVDAIIKKRNMIRERLASYVAVRINHMNNDEFLSALKMGNAAQQRVLQDIKSCDREDFIKCVDRAAAPTAICLDASFLPF